MIAQAGKTFRFCPRMVLAQNDAIYAALCCRYFRRLGWEVFLVGTSREARELARQLAPLVVVLATDLRDESGWLTCEKLIRERHDQKVILVAPKIKADSHQFAEFVGAAALISQEAGVQALVDEVLGTALPAAG